MKRIELELWACVIWRLWKSKNDLVFEGKKFEVEKVYDDIRVRLWSWVLNIFPNVSNCPFFDWTMNLCKIVDLL